jgi:glycerol-3-phosphate cytidylyltransferase-like family protein
MMNIYISFYYFKTNNCTGYYEIPDNEVQKVKIVDDTPPPLKELFERMEVVSSCKWVDKVIINTGGADSKPAILEAKADVIVVGSDWETKDYHKQMGFTQEWLDEHNIKVIFVPYSEHISTTIIKSRILDRMFQ